MRKPQTIALATLLTGALLVPAPASAVHDQGSRFSVASQFRVGGLDVALVYGSRGSRYTPQPYYRFPRRIAYSGYHCTDRCFVNGGHYYHHASCPLASIYFSNHSFDPGRFWARISGPGHRDSYRPHAYRVPPGHRKPHHSYRARRHFKVPPGHLPPPGECKVWYPDRPPGHQGPPVDCWTAEQTAYRTGGFVVYGGAR